MLWPGPDAGPGTEAGGIRRPAFEQLEPRRPLSATPSLGAIYWDGWFAATLTSRNCARQYEDRLPFYTRSLHRRRHRGQRLAGVMDQEIQSAQQGGLSYFAFDWYRPTHSFQAPTTTTTAFTTT